jgi:hypothetical protein
MAGQIVHDDDVAGSQCRSEELLHPGEACLAKEPSMKVSASNRSPQRIADRFDRLPDSAELENALG